MQTLNTDVKKPGRKTGLLLVLIFFIGLLFRMEYIRGTSLDTPVRADAMQYVIYAYNLVHHGVFSKDFPSHSPLPDAFRSPGYPIFLSLFIRFFGDIKFYSPVVMFQAVLSAFLVLLTFFAGLFILPRRWNLFACILVAFSPHLVSMPTYLLREILFAFIVISGILCFFIAVRKNRRFFFGIAGLLFGFSYLVNETIFFIPFIFSILLFWTGTGKRKDHRLSERFDILVFLVVFSLFPLAWSIRNARLPENSQTGTNLALTTMTHGAYPEFMYKTEKYRYYPYKEDPLRRQFESSFGAFIKILWNRSKKEPAKYLKWYFIQKPYYLWSWHILQGHGEIYVYPVKKSFYQTYPPANFTLDAMRLMHPFLLCLFGAGLPLVLFRYKKGRVTKSDSDILSLEIPLYLYVFAVYFTVLYMVFAPWPRYSIPFRPVFYLLSLWSFYGWLDVLFTSVKKTFQGIRER